jgi:GTP-binding protein HflX
LQIYGDTTGLSPSERKALERIYRRRVPADVLTSNELTRGLSEISHATRRQIGALVQRSGQVEFVVIGDSAKLMLPDIGRFRAGGGRFRGLRLIHTHLRNEPLSRDDLVDLTRLRLDLVAAICLSPEGNPQTVHYAHCVPLAIEDTAPALRGGARFEPCSACSSPLIPPGSKRREPTSTHCCAITRIAS